MSRNRVLEHGDSFPVTVPAGTLSGAPVAVGQLPGVARIDRMTVGEHAGKATVDFHGVYNLAVVGQEWNGTAIVSVAIAEGAILYLNGTTINRDNRGVRYGYALDPVASGATTTIRVKVGY